MKMECFDAYILHVLNRGLRERRMKGEFSLRKFYKKGVFPIQKNMTLVLSYTLPGESKELVTITRTYSLRREDIEKGYDMLFEELLYVLMHNNIWDLAYGI